MEMKRGCLMGISKGGKASSNASSWGKRGMYFTVDAMIAVSIIFITLMLITSTHVSKKENTSSASAASDIVHIFTQAKVSELDNPYVQLLINDGTIKNSNNSVFDQLGEFWALGQYDLAQRFISNISQDLVPSQFGMMVVIGDDIMYSNNKSLTASLASSRKIISGIAKDKPTDGFTSKAYLTSISEKRSSSFAYFGGFVGQGNITIPFEDIPLCAVLREMYLELDAKDAFLVFINEEQCQSDFLPLGVEMTAERWNITSCLGSVNANEQNNLTILFPNSLQNAYVGGGFGEVAYLTDALSEQADYGIKTEWMPKISGIVNLYSSFYIPGSLNSMDASIHYYISPSNTSNFTLYLSIGDQVVFRAINTSNEGVIILNDTNFSMLSYADLSQKTVPLRIGFENLTFVTKPEGNGDVALITDLSGSMAWRMDQDGVNGVKRNCDDAQFSDIDTRRMSVAKCLDVEFVLDILNVTGNMLGLIAFSTTTDSSRTVNLTANFSRLNQTIGTSIPQTGYVEGGWTCICCGINSATSVLAQSLRNETLVAKGSAWLFTNHSFYSEPAPDDSGNAWYGSVYANETDWFSGSAVLGATNGYAYAP